MLFPSAYLSKEHSIKLFIINLELTIYSSFQDTETLFIIYPVLSILSSSQRNMNSAYHEPYAWHPIKFHKRKENIFCINRTSDIYWNLQRIWWKLCLTSLNVPRDHEAISSLTFHHWHYVWHPRRFARWWKLFIINIIMTMFDNHSSSLDT